MFDPYHQWLGIPPDRRPPTHYQLLGIMPDEQDPQVIESATVRQSSYVRHFQNGPHARECARVLGELAQARLTLVDPARRAAYDALLASKARAEPPVAPPAPSLSIEIVAEADDLQGGLARGRPARVAGSRAGRRGSSGRFGKVVTHLAITACCLAVIAFFVRRMLEPVPTVATASQPPEDREGPRDSPIPQPAPPEAAEVAREDARGPAANAPGESPRREDGLPKDLLRADAVFEGVKDFGNRAERPAVLTILRRAGDRFEGSLTVSNPTAKTVPIEGTVRESALEVHTPPGSGHPPVMKGQVRGERIEFAGRVRNRVGIELEQGFRFLAK